MIPFPMTELVREDRLDLLRGSGREESVVNDDTFREEGKTDEEGVGVVRSGGPIDDEDLAEREGELLCEILNERVDGRFGVERREGVEEREDDERVERNHDDLESEAAAKASVNRNESKGERT